MKDFDPILHPPTRLQLAAVLNHADEVEFAKLREIVDVSDSVLSKHLAALSDASYVLLRKAKHNGRQRTSAALTGKGRRAFAAHMKTLQALVETAETAVAAE